MLTYDFAVQVAGRTPQWQEDYRRQGWRINARVIPSVAYTDPEVAWVSLTEDEDEAKGIKVKNGVFPLRKWRMAVVRIYRLHAASSQSF